MTHAHNAIHYLQGEALSQRSAQDLKHLHLVVQLEEGITQGGVFGDERAVYALQCRQLLVQSVVLVRNRSCSAHQPLVLLLHHDDLHARRHA